jgi:hypothetical protein
MDRSVEFNERPAGRLRRAGELIKAVALIPGYIIEGI